MFPALTLTLSLCLGKMLGSCEDAIVVIKMDVEVPGPPCLCLSEMLWVQ